jgi:hypothetical protein
MAEELEVERVDGFIVSFPATKTTFYIHRTKTPLGVEKEEITPITLPEEKIKGFIEAIKGVLPKKKEELKEVV